MREIEDLIKKAKRFLIKKDLGKSLNDAYDMRQAGDYGGVHYAFLTG